MKMILLLVFMAWFKTGPSVCSECSLEECKISPDWQDQLICYYEKYLFVHCSWQPYLSNTKIIGYKLHLFWPSVEKTRKPCYLINTSKTFQKIDRSNLRIYENANVWVSAFYPNSTCSRTSMFSFIPMKAVKCSPPAISGHQLSNTLILNWQSTKTLYMLRYKEISSFNWTYVNMTSPNNTVVLPKSSRSSSFSAQMRCIPDDSCFHCDWGTETVIIHKLTEKPNITKIASKPLTKPPGTRTVFISWEVSQRRHVKGYEVTVESLAKNDRLKPMKSRVNTTSLEFNLAMAYFRITIFAYNDVGESPNSSVVVPDTPFTGLPGVLYATSKTRSVILTWHPVLPRKCFVIEYGMNHSDIKLLFARNRKQQYVLKGPFEVGQRYIVLLHTLKKCSTMANGSTFGMTHIYAIEGVPRKAPSNVAIHNVTQHAAAVQWAAIPEEDRMGLLRGYRIYCTESGKNTTTAFYVNYSTANSYTLTGLSENAIYRLQIAGITNAGEGARSSEQLFSTSTDDSGGMGRFIPGFGILAIPVLCAGYSMLKRIKKNVCGVSCFQGNRMAIIAYVLLRKIQRLPNV
ncbi:interleukin-6 receptor subunit beta-like isoform X2 [Ambystoma mexicanum]|uniref:interleukin-6 receptor subunit beta-like isoform X2 n=1 Tax=Ambystoma mexicanum TaxID=8296 RepID=UPI0037E99537